MNDTLKPLEEVIKQGKRLRMKVTIISDDGKNWKVIKQHYVSCVENGEFIDIYLQGEHFQLEKYDSMERQNEKEKREEG